MQKFVTCLDVDPITDGGDCTIYGGQVIHFFTKILKEEGLCKVCSTQSHGWVGTCENFFQTCPQSQLQHYWRWVICISECSWNIKSEHRMENKIITMAQRVLLPTLADQNSIITLFLWAGFEFFPDGKTLNSEFSAGVLKRLMRAVLRRRPQYWERGGWFLLHNSACTHLV